MNPTPEFRHDIHCLRALAVIAVVLFHFDVAGFGGGFVGVDVFFVISGFLMTGIILGGIDRGDFSILRFYWARVRRIVPALAVLCAVLLAFGWFWLGPTEYALLGKHGFSSLGFGSNFVYKDESGYFDAPSQQKWLLHSWALSTEWQFYMLYPLILAWVARRCGGVTRAMGWTLAAMTALSFGAGLVTSPLKPDFSFFLLPVRVWEMVAGGLVYLHATRAGRRLPQWTAALGLALFALSVAWFISGMVWPGYAALLPVAGAVLFMAAAPQHPLVRHPFFQRIGDWSYSIYLWHWPLYVAMAYFGLRFTGWQAAGIGASVLLGALSYAWVEQPARRLPFTRRHMGVILLPVAALAGACWLVFSHQGYPSRVDAAILAADNEARNELPAAMLSCGTGVDPSQPQRTLCLAGADGGAPAAILWGDSHAGAVVGALQAHLRQPVALFGNQCPVIFDARLKGKNQKANCGQFHEEVRQYVKAAPAHVPLVIASRFSAQVHGPNENTGGLHGLAYDRIREEERGLDAHALYHKRLVESLCEVAAIRRTYVLLPIPEIGQHVPRTVVRQLITGQPVAASLPRAQYDARHAVVRAALLEAARECGVTVLDTPSYLCTEQECEGVKDGRPLYVDDDHLSEYGNRLLVPMFRDAGL